MPLPLEPPVTPDGDQARQWAEQELADPVYHAAEPTPFDRFARGVGDFLQSLLSGDVSPALAPWLAIIVVAVIVGIGVLAFVVWGRPRRAERSRRPAELFGVDDGRPAALLRADAEEAATAARWDDAVVLRFRALARGLVERTILDPEPGTTVHRFAAQAARAFPAERAALGRAADLFDDARYLHRPVDAASYRSVAELDVRLDDTRPVLDGVREADVTAGSPS